MMPVMTSPEKFVAPELQILTPSYMVGYLNGISSLVKNGVSEQCDSGLPLGVRTYDLDDGAWRLVCPQGRLTWDAKEESHTPERVIHELDVLLTGGRLSPVAKLAVRNAFELARDGHRIR